eukprot:2681062-Ditylum_brightwellii.AAC.1
MEKEELRCDLPFAEAIPSDVKMPPQPDTKIVKYINDAHTTAIDNEDVFRPKKTFPLALGLLFCKSGKHEPIEKDEILPKMKMEREGILSKLKIFLGWFMDSPLFQVQLPRYKDDVWSKEVIKLLRGLKPFILEDIKLLIGKLNRAGFIIPLSRHFLNRIRWWFIRKRGRNDMQKDIP